MADSITELRLAGLILFAQNADSVAIALHDPAACGIDSIMPVDDVRHNVTILYLRALERRAHAAIARIVATTQITDNEVVGVLMSMDGLLLTMPQDSKTAALTAAVAMLREKFNIPVSGSEA